MVLLCFADMAITEEMMVTHFLIQPDPEGVKLQGWNERAFSKRIIGTVCV